MTFMVPFDGTPLSRAALERASTYGDALAEEVFALSIVPDDDLYAREKDWIEDGGDFEPEAVAGELREMVLEIAPDARFEWRTTRDASPDTVTDAIRSVAADREPAVVFLGSENAGQIVTPLSSVGGGVASNADYDVHIVRTWSAANPP